MLSIHFLILLLPLQPPALTEQHVRETEFKSCSLAGEITHSVGHETLFQHEAYDNFHLLELP